jgi:hypothetical protein
MEGQLFIRPIPPKANFLSGRSHGRPTFYQADPTEGQLFIRPLPPKANFLSGRSHGRPTFYQANPMEGQLFIRPIPPKANSYQSPPTEGQLFIKQDFRTLKIVKLRNKSWKPECDGSFNMD